MHTNRSHFLNTGFYIKYLSVNFKPHYHRWKSGYENGYCKDYISDSVSVRTLSSWWFELQWWYNDFKFVAGNTQTVVSIVSCGILDSTTVEAIFVHHWRYSNDKFSHRNDSNYIFFGPALLLSNFLGHTLLASPGWNVLRFWWENKNDLSQFFWGSNIDVCLNTYP